MKKKQTDTKSEKSNDLFFKSQNSAENQTLGLVNSSEMLKNQAVTTSAEKPDAFFNFIKQVFLFLPGTFLLYLIGFTGTFILINIFSAQEPSEIFGIHSVPLQILIFGIITLFGTFMTWFGLGDIKNKKHFAIPTSIIATGGLISSILMVLEKLFGFGIYEGINYYFMYLFPLVLIVPILVKGWIDRKTED